MTLKVYLIAFHAHQVKKKMIRPILCFEKFDINVRLPIPHQVTVA